MEATTVSSIIGCPLGVSKALGNDTKQSLMVPLAPRILTGASVFFFSRLVQSCWRFIRDKEPVSTRVDQIDLGFKSGVFEFQMGPRLQGIQRLHVTDSPVVGQNQK